MMRIKHYHLYCVIGKSVNHAKEKEKLSDKDSKKRKMKA